MFFPWILWFYSFCSGIYISRTKIKNFIVLRKLRRYLEHCFMKHSSSLFVQLEKFLSFLTFEEASSLLPHFWGSFLITSSLLRKLPHYFLTFEETSSLLPLCFLTFGGSFLSISSFEPTNLRNPILEENSFLKKEETVRKHWGSVQLSEVL